jgi:beta-galactosidase
MEQQCGNVNWSVNNTGIRPGTVRLWTWHALASGAEAVLFFRWRAGLFAQEQFHSGLLHHDASPAVGLTDLETMKDERLRMSEIALAPHKAQIAFLLDYDSLWAMQLQPHNPDFDYMRQVFVYYRALLQLGLPADIVSIDADLNAYKLVIVLTAFLGTEQLVHSLQTYVEGGGTILLSVRSGFKISSNRVTDQPLPGLFRELVGATVGDWHSLPPGISYDLDSLIPGMVGPAAVWAEALIPAYSDSQSIPDLQVLAHYISGPFNSSAALVEHKVKAGKVYYLGWYPSDAQAEVLLAYLTSQVGVVRLATLQEGVIVSQRGTQLILLNFTDEPKMAIVQGRTILVGSRDVELVEIDTS